MDYRAGSDSALHYDPAGDPRDRESVPADPAAQDSIQHMNYGELALNRNIEDTDDEIQMLTSAFYDMLDKMKSPEMNW